MALGHSQARFALRLNRVQNRLCLRQIQTPIQKGPLGEFPRFSQASASRDTGFDYQPKHYRAPVRVYFHHIFRSE
jgi:hypothetical protein